jgi:hypothetical protein
MNAKSSVGENITIDAKHNEMLKYFKDLQKSLPALKNELKESIQKYKSIDLSKNNDFELIMEKDRLRDSIVELKERINKISSKEEENNYFLEVGLLLHNYYENVETAKNVESDSKNFEKNLLYTSDNENENDNIIQDEEDDDLEDGDDEIESVPEKVSYKSVIHFFNDRELKGGEVTNSLPVQVKSRAWNPHWLSVAGLTLQDLRKRLEEDHDGYVQSVDKKSVDVRG